MLFMESVEFMTRRWSLMLGLHHERRHQRDDGMEGRQIKKGSETCSDRAGGVCLTWFGIKVNSWDTMNVARLIETPQKTYPHT